MNFSTIALAVAFRLLFLEWVVSEVSVVGHTTRYLAMNGTDSLCLTDSTGQTPCQTLRRALSNATFNMELLVYPGTYEYGSERIKVDYFQNLTIRKFPMSSESVVFQCSSTSETKFNDLAFYGGQNLTIYGITVRHCGTISTGLFISRTDGVLISNCTFIENTGGSLTLYNSKNAVVTSCIFSDNIGMRPDRTANETTFNFVSHSSGGLAIILFSFSSNGNITVSHCQFVNNKAGLNARNADDKRPIAYRPFGSGGAMIIRIASSAKSISVRVVDCSFWKNEGLYSGGSIYVPIIEEPRNNSVLIKDCEFSSSSCRNGTGGAIAIDVFNVQESNVVNITNSNFKDGEAFGGGAVAVVLHDGLASSHRAPDSRRYIASFSNCTFENNTSIRQGSAVLLLSNARIDQPSFIIYFDTCAFIKNKAIEAGAAGTILAFRFPTSFSGSNSFTGNVGGGMVLQQSRMDVYGVLRFNENTAVEGGGIIVEDQSFLNLHQGVEVVFNGNMAELGGALFVRYPNADFTNNLESFFNTECFIQYNLEADESSKLSPDMWINLSVKIINNTATHGGAAIYVSSVGKCIFTKSDCRRNNASEISKKLMLSTVSSFLNQSGNRVDVREQANEKLVLNQEVATAASNLTVVPNKYLAAPGEKITYTIQARDQTGNSRAGVWTFRDSQFREGYSEFYSVSDIASAVHPITFQSRNISQERCQDSLKSAEGIGETSTGDVPEDIKFFIIDANSGEVSSETNLAINISCCHPGYVYYAPGRTCVFNANYPHLLRPSEDNRYVYLEPGYYAGYYNDTSRNEVYFTTSFTLSVFLNCTKQSNRPGCLYMFDSPDEQCANNRTGYLCGKCPEGYGVDLTLRQCKKCSAGDAVGLAIICVVMVALSTVVLVFNVELHNDLKGFLFYVQVIGFIYFRDRADGTSWDFQLSRFLCFSLYIPICPFTTLPTLWTTAFGFLPSILITSTVVVYIFCARHSKALSQRTAFSGIWLLFLIVYKFIADTAANVLTCARIEGDAVKKRHDLSAVFVYDGSVPCFSGQHLILAIPSIMLMIVVGIAPFIIVLISFKRFKRTTPFTDVITKGIKTKCRWWSGFEVGRRLLFILVVVIFDIVSPQYEQLALCFSSMIVLAVLCIAKPYEKYYENVIEGLILFDLLLISFLFLNEGINRRLPTRYSYFSICSLLIPFVYAVVNICIRISVKIWKQYKSKQNWESLDLEVSDATEISYDSNTWSKDYYQAQIPCNDFSRLREDLLEEPDN